VEPQVNDSSRRGPERVDVRAACAAGWNIQCGEELTRRLGYRVIGAQRDLHAEAADPVAEHELTPHGCVIAAGDRSAVDCLEQHAHLAEDRRYRRPLLDSRAPIIDGYLKWLIGHVNNQEASMSGNVVYVGIDVDDVQYHGSALDRQTGEVLSFQCRPTLKGLIGQLDNVRKHFGGVALKLC